MKNLDVYIRDKIIEVDLFVRELAQRKDVSIYSDLILLSQEALIYLYRFVVLRSDAVLDSKILEASRQVYAQLASKSSLKGRVTPVKLAFSRIEDKSFLGTNEITPTRNRLAAIASLASLTSEITIPIARVSLNSLDNTMSLSSKLVDDFYQLICCANISLISEINSQIVECMYRYVSTLPAESSLYVHLTEVFVTRFRRFQDIREDDTVNDIGEMTIEDFVFITR